MQGKVVISRKLFYAISLLSLYITIFGLFWPIDFRCFITGGECIKVYGYPFIIFKTTKEGLLLTDRNFWVLIENFFFWMVFLMFFWVVMIVGLEVAKKLAELLKL